jgi:hypothetical protein
MIHETVTSLPAAEILARAKAFFAERVPLQAAFPEKEGPGFLTLRGQGGEELSLVVIPGSGASRVRASTLFFDQPLARFLATLPPGSEAA